MHRPYARGGDGPHELAQERQRVRVLVRGVAVGEVLADVAQPGGAEERVHDGVREDVGVGVPKEAAVVRDLDAAEDELAPFHESVGVPADAGSRRRVHGAPSGTSRRLRRSKTAISDTPTASSASSARS